MNNLEQKVKKAVKLLAGPTASDKVIDVYTKLFVHIAEQHAKGVKNFDGSSTSVDDEPLDWEAREDEILKMYRDMIENHDNYDR